jgi:hypothetical protein
MLEESIELLTMAYALQFNLYVASSFYFAVILLTFGKTND